MANQNLARHQQPVRLYYLGGFVKDQPIVSAKGVAFKVPPVGEYLEVARLFAKDLIRRNKMPSGMSVFTEDRRFAEAVIAQRNRGGEPAETVQPKEYSREELLEMLAALDVETQEEVVNKTGRKTKETA